jgi:hypothetical protein
VAHVISVRGRSQQPGTGCRGCRQLGQGVPGACYRCVDLGAISIDVQRPVIRDPHLPLRLVFLHLNARLEQQAARKLGTLGGRDDAILAAR